MSKHNKTSAGKKQYTEQEVIDKYKNDYEKTMKSLKEEHDSSMLEPNIKIADLSDKIKDIEESKSPFHEKLDKYKKELGDINKYKTNAEYTTIAVMEAEKLWLAVKIAVIANNKFMSMTDEEKIDLIRKDFAEFYNNFPIVSRYMLCMGQYNQKAFRKFLKKCEQRLNQTPTEKEEGFMQNQWVECQASYVRYLWEEMQTKRFSRKESNAVWEQTHKALTEEFKQFKTKHTQVEENLKQEDKKNKVELLSEAVHRISSGAQKLDLEKTRALVNKLRDTKYRQNYDIVLQQILDNDIITPASVSGRGINIDAQYAHEEELKQSEYKKKYKKMDLAPKMF